jgi:hypothetical protein
MGSWGVVGFTKELWDSALSEEREARDNKLFVCMEGLSGQENWGENERFE